MEIFNGRWLILQKASARIFEWVLNTPLVYDSFMYFLSLTITRLLITSYLSFVFAKKLYWLTSLMWRYNYCDIHFIIQSKIIPCSKLSQRQLLMLLIFSKQHCQKHLKVFWLILQISVKIKCHSIISNHSKISSHSTQKYRSLLISQFKKQDGDLLDISM